MNQVGSENKLIDKNLCYQVNSGRTRDLVGYKLKDKCGTSHVVSFADVAKWSVMFRSDRGMVRNEDESRDNEFDSPGKSWK